MSYQKGLVSVIVPVHDTDPILMERCFSSLYGQSYKKIEILVIDDGSKKKDTLLYLDKIKKQKRRTAVVRKKNGGVSSARNLGIKLSNGEYIYFVDSDDYIDIDAIEKLVKVIIKSDYVEAISKKIPVFNGCSKSFKLLEEGSIDAKNDFVEILTNTISFTSQGALIKADCAKKYEFDENVKYGEDFQYNFKILNSGKVYYTNRCAYYYVQNAQSALNEISRSNSDRYLSDFNAIYKEIEGKFPEKQNVIDYMICDKINLTLKRNYINSPLDYREYRKLIKKYRDSVTIKRFPGFLANMGRNVLVCMLYWRMYYLHFLVTKIRIIFSEQLGGQR